MRYFRLGATAVAVSATFAAFSTANAAIGPEGLPSVSQGAHADAAPRLHFRTRNAAPRHFVAPPRSAAEVAEFRNLQRASMAPGKPLAIGSLRNLANVDQSVDGARLNWQKVSGGYAAVLNFKADGARGLRLTFKLSGPSHGVTLRFAGSAHPDEVFEVNGASTVSQARYWSPVTEGDSMRVEVFVADGVHYKSVKLTKLALMHMDQIAVTPGVTATVGGLGQSVLACQRDISCNPNQTQAYRDLTNAVLGVSYVEGGNSYWCTGTLMNSNTTPKQPYVITANHCIHSQESAASIYSVWFMDATGCGSGERGPKYTVLREGGTLLFNTAIGDHAFVRLNGTPPAGSTYIGWSPSGLGNGTQVMGIHHPNADLKKYSEGFKAGDNSRLNGVPGTYHVVSWGTGAVEHGSSGSGLFTLNPQSQSYQLVGQLYGTLNGEPTCSSQAIYGRLQDYYGSISQWLDPVAPFAMLNSASFTDQYLAPDELVSGWGAQLPATPVARTASDRADPADTRCTFTLGGRYSVNVRSNTTGETKEACLLFLGANQANFKIPAGFQPGDHVDVSLIDAAQGRSLATAVGVQIVDFAPGLYTVSQNGKGIAAGNIVRVKNSVQTWSNIPATASTPIDLGPADEEVFVVLYGTGLRNKPNTLAPTARIAGIDAPVEYVGTQRDYLGLDQINLRVPKAALRSAGISGKAVIELKFADSNGRQSIPNPVEIYIK